MPVSIATTPFWCVSGGSALITSTVQCDCTLDQTLISRLTHCLPSPLIRAPTQRGPIRPKLGLPTDP
ncbi:hypothetical protein PR003_g18970 [Phytophthora rubi]|uniref:Uncharacterized protein n=1 Tax=Phytophthora rubi TaxID=129364 RepID=A0A6A3L545_9STRA|nr:hypothetical protein PF003_g39918 [Phytophthora fragariae]KAE9014756.1 hypothetical protein PR001_g15059 [Phytophthora rubi]KAE9315519.1 hypothetical protein PR003_g18970 [Phytophthora rubi]